jgi:TonB dependent receptor
VPLTAARQWRNAWYFQDNWKATPKLTLNLGLRYDLWVPPHDNLDTSRTLNFNTSPPTVVDLPNPIWKITHKDFAPRIGVAYLLPHQFVVRAGYGITFYGGQFDNINILQLNPPVDPSFTLTNGYTPSNPPTATIQFPVSPSLAAANANVATLPMNDQHPDLYLQTYNLTVSKQFWSNVIDISYVGVKGNHQDTSDENFNTGPPQPASGNVNANRPYPTFGTIRLIDFSGGASSYNGLNIHFEHRFSHQLEFTGSYSWSHLLDNQGTDINNGSSETQIPASKEWASGLTDQRNYLTIAFVWELPKVSGGNAAMRAVVNGWGINSIYQYISGSPLWMTQSVDGENNGNQNQRPDLVPGQPLKLAHRTNAEFFNTARYTTAIAHYGSTPRNPVTGVKNDPLTLAVKRIFPLPFEGQHLDFRFEAFNAFNHPQFAAPGVVQGSSTFGVITGTHTDNRDLQLALKYIF